MVIVGALETNCYLVYCRETMDCAVIDPGAEPERIMTAITSLKLHPKLILNTHGHIDHTGANADLKEKYGINLFIHANDREVLNSALFSELGFLLDAKLSPAPDGYLKDGDDIKIGKHSFRVIHTPGHTPGSVIFYSDQGWLFSGDTIFNGGVGRTDLPGGSEKDLWRSIHERILVLPDETVVFPGHGPRTTISEEKSVSPLLL